MISKRIDIDAAHDNYARLANYIADVEKKKEKERGRTNKKQFDLARLARIARHGLRKLSQLRLVQEQGHKREKGRPLLLLPSVSRDNRQRNNNLRRRDNQPGRKTLITWAKGTSNDDDYGLAIKEIVHTQAQNTRAKNPKTYHLVVSFRPEDATKLQEKDFQAIEKRFAKALGLEEHQRHCAVHINTDNMHMHVAYNLIHPEKLVHIEPYRDYVSRDRLCRELEKEYGLAVDNGRDQKREDGLSQKAATVEAHSGNQSFEAYAKEQAAEIMPILEQAQTWEDLHKIFAEHGLLIQRRAGGLVVKNRHGKQMAKASAVSREITLKKLESRLGKYKNADKEKLPESKTKYKTRAVQKSPERGQLWEKYQQLKAEQKAEMQKIHFKWAEYRKKLEQKPEISKKSIQALLKLTKQKENMEKKEYQLTQPATWLDFLKKEAERGDENALAVLRSRKEEIAPEQTVDMALEQQKAEILARTDLKQNTKNTLISHAIMHSVAAEAQSKISAHGVIVYSLPDGGKVCDTGKSIVFSENAEETAIAFMQKKWNLRIKKTEKDRDGKTVIVLTNGQKLEAKNNTFERPVFKPIEKQKSVER